jgi:hypothetical protein
MFLTIPEDYIIALKSGDLGLLKAVRYLLSGDQSHEINGRIIGYAAAGKFAKEILPLLSGSVYQPTELWDQNPVGNIKSPDYESLTPEDIVLILSHKYNSQIENTLKNYKCKIITANKLSYITAILKHPGLKIKEST